MPRPKNIVVQRWNEKVGFYYTDEFVAFTQEIYEALKNLKRAEVTWPAAQRRGRGQPPNHFRPSLDCKQLRRAFALGDREDPDLDGCTNEVARQLGIPDHFKHSLRLIIKKAVGKPTRRLRQVLRTKAVQRLIA